MSASKTFDIKDLYSSTDYFQDNSFGKKSSPVDGISLELELSEFLQNKRLSEKMQKRLFYQNQIDELKRKLKEKGSPAKHPILQVKDELQNSQNLSKSLNQLLQSEYALKSRISGSEKNLDSIRVNQENLDKRRIFMRGTIDSLMDSKGDHQEIDHKITDFERSKEETHEDFENKRILKGNQDNLDQSHFRKRGNSTEIENLEILRPVIQDPFRKVFEKKDGKEEKIKDSLKKEENKQLYKRYLQLLKKKKSLMESQGLGEKKNEKNADLEKILNEIAELKKMNEDLMEEVKKKKRRPEKSKGTQYSQRVENNHDASNQCLGKAPEEKENIENQEFRDCNSIKDRELREMMKKVKATVRRKLSENPRNNPAERENFRKYGTRKKNQKALFCDECAFLLNKGKSTNFCQIHGKAHFKVTIPKRLAMIS